MTKRQPAGHPANSTAYKNARRAFMARQGPAGICALCGEPVDMRLSGRVALDRRSRPTVVGGGQLLRPLELAARSSAMQCRQGPGGGVGCRSWISRGGRPTLPTGRPLERRAHGPRTRLAERARVRQSGLRLVSGRGIPDVTRRTADDRLAGLLVRAEGYVDRADVRRGLVMARRHLETAGLHLWGIPDGLEVQLVIKRRPWWRPNVRSEQ